MKTPARSAKALKPVEKEPSSRLLMDEVCLLLKLPTMDERLRVWAEEQAGVAYDDKLRQVLEVSDDVSEAVRQAEEAEEQAEHACASGWAKVVRDRFRRVTFKFRLSARWTKEEWNFWRVDIQPRLSWIQSAEAMRKSLHESDLPFSFPTLEEFLASGVTPSSLSSAKRPERGPYTPREAVLRYLHWLIDCGWAFESDRDERDGFDEVASDDEA